MKRLSQASGKTIDVSGLIPQSQQAAAPQAAAPPTDPVDTDDESEAMQLLKSLRDMTP